MRPFYIKIKPSTSPDVHGYRIYAEPEGTDVTADSDHSMEQLHASLPLDAEGVARIDISGLLMEVATPGKDAGETFSVGITAFDKFQNESPIVTGSAFFDLAAPAAPTLLGFEQG